jgi:hypothetical protein
VARIVICWLTLIGLVEGLDGDCEATTDDEEEEEIGDNGDELVSMLSN